jgi:hypothetical protein
MQMLCERSIGQEWCKRAPRLGFNMHKEDITQEHFQLNGGDLAVLVVTGQSRYDTEISHCAR